MNEAPPLRLAAVDAEDLAVISAHVQDAVLKVGDLLWLPAEKRFAAGMNRFVWEAARDVDGGYQRRRAALTFDRVRAVRSIGVDRARPDAVVELLAVSFAAAEEPSGRVTLVLAGGGAIELDVEVVEARLADLGPAWATGAKPSHEGGERAGA